MQLVRLSLLSLTSASLLVACADDPVQVSDVVDLKVTVSSGDVEAGALLEEKNINTESGNPYAVFLSGARDTLGREPGRITVEAAALTLEPTSRGVASLGEVFAGTTRLELVMNGSTTRYPIASHDMIAADAAGPITFDAELDSVDLPEADFADLASGSFKVVLAGPAAPGFAGAKADADLRMSLTFGAYE